MKFLMIVLMFGTSFAGERDSHGGGGFLCKDEQGQEYVQLLDKWEAQAFNERNFYHFDGDYKAVLKSIMNNSQKRYSKPFLRRIQYNLSLIMEQTYFLKPDQGVSISPPRDAENSFFKTGCVLKGIASFKGSTLNIDTELWNKMDPNEQAALYIHEAVYMMLRNDMGAKDSRLARSITANILIPSNDFIYFTGDTYTCTDQFGENSFYILDVGVKDRRGAVLMVNGYSESMGRESLYIDRYKTAKEIYEDDKFLFGTHLEGRPMTNQLIYQRTPSDNGEVRFKLKNVRRVFEPIVCKKLI